METKKTYVKPEVAIDLRYTKLDGEHMLTAKSSGRYANGTGADVESAYRNLEANMLYDMLLTVTEINRKELADLHRGMREALGEEGM